MNAQPKLPPLDPDAVNMPDADRERRERYLRKALAEGRESPSRLRMMRSELQQISQEKRGAK